MKISQIKYQRYDIENLKTAYISAIEKIQKANSASEIVNARNALILESVKFDTAFNLAFIRWSQNVKDDFYLKEKEYYEDNSPLLNDVVTEYINALINSKFYNELEKIFPKTLFPLLKNKLLTSSPKISSGQVEEAKLVSKYSNFLSSMLIEYNGEKIPLTLLKKYLTSIDREVRKSSYQAFGKRLKESREFLDDNFSSLVKIRDKMAKKLGFENYIPLGYAGMQRICYGKEELDNLKKNIKKYVVPTACKIKEITAKKLNIKGLKLYDYESVFSKREITPKNEGEKLLNDGLNVYLKMSEKTGEFFKFMLDADAVDYESRKDKWGGGYQTDLSYYNQPFILANFNGTSQDVDVLTHEAGHAYASYLMSKAGVDKEVGLPFMDIAETHSMTMEFLCWKYLEEIFGEDAKEYKLKHLSDSFCFLTYGVIVDEFQTKVYENPSLTPSQRNELWLSLEREYRPYLSSNGIEYFEEGTRWQYQMHIFENPFYYIDYVLAQITALSFLKLSIENYSLAFEKYNEFISLGADVDYLTALKKVGMKSPFDEQNLKEISSFCLELFEKLSKNSKF